MPTVNPTTQAPVKVTPCLAMLLAAGPVIVIAGADVLIRLKLREALPVFPALSV